MNVRELMILGGEETLMNWTNGRQNSDYKKLKIFESKLLKMDMYLIKYDIGDWIPYHTDKVPGKEHHRFNITLSQAQEGGKFTTHHRTKPKLWTRRTILFRPDLEPHGVSKVRKGKRYVISIGWLR